jgi:tRNA pseudouridine55 synthase
MEGILNVDKPPGVSSARVVARVKRLLPRGTKIGHAGTLDPFATGVLLLLVGKATKACERLMDLPKQYETVIRLGATTETDDPETPAIPWAPVRQAQGRPAGGSELITPNQDAIESALKAFTGQIMQRPPAYSALKVGGRRAYDLARAGHDVALQPRPVNVYRIELLDYTWPLLRLRIDCGRGTYIRAIARDLGVALDVGGHLAELRRTGIGKFRIQDAVPPEVLETEGVASHLKQP